MKRILYVSRSLVAGDDTAMNAIAAAALRRNSKCAVTGYLYYDSDIFLQVIEGMAKDVDAVYAAIKRDKRHRNVRKLVDEPIDARSFGGWAMGFYNGDRDGGPVVRLFSESLPETTTEADGAELIRFLRDLSIGRDDVYTLPSAALL